MSDEKLGMSGFTSFNPTYTLYNNWLMVLTTFLIQRVYFYNSIIWTFEK